MTSKGLGDMFEGDSADMCAGKFPLVSMGPSGGSRVRRPGSDYYEVEIKTTQRKGGNY